MKYSLLTLSVLSCGMALAAAADLTGKVTLKGTPPAAVEISMDETCGKLHTEKVTTRHYVVGKDAGLANVLVYVKSGLTGAQKAPDAVPVVDQKNCMYEPYITGLMVGQKLKIKNSDTTVPLHNVHASQNLLTGGGKDFFNDPQPANAADLEKTFSAPEVMVKFKCDVHQWMFAYVAVVENPYFAVTDKDGNFTIKGLPAGKYTVVAFHEKTHRGGTGVSQEVTVSGDAKADFTVALP